MTINLVFSVPDMLLYIILLVAYLLPGLILALAYLKYFSNIDVAYAASYLLFWPLHAIRGFARRNK